MTSFSIRNLSAYEFDPSSGSKQILASFRLITGGIEINSCTLVRSVDGAIYVGSPRGKGPAGNSIFVSIVDEALRQAVCNRSVDAYEALMGTQIREVEAGG